MVFKYVSIIVSFVFVAATLCGDSVRLEVADTASAAAATSFNSVGNWSNNEAPSSAHDYVVDLGSESGIVLPSANATFNGASLQIGSAENSGRLNVLTTGKTYTMANLILNSGIINVAPNVKTTFNGAFTVASTLNNPFVIQGGSGSDMTYPNHSFYGDSDSAVLIKGVGGVFLFHPPTWYQYHQSNYKGRWIVDNAVFMVASFSTYAGEVFREDAIILRNNGILRGNASNPKFSHSKIGVTIEETGGKIQHGYGGKINTISIPFKGGPLTIEKGVNTFSSKLKLSKFTVSTSNDENGIVAIASGAIHDISEIIITSGDLRYNKGVVYENTSPCPVKVRGGRLLVDNFNFEKNYIVLEGGQIYSSQDNGLVTNLIYNSGSVRVPFNTTENRPSMVTVLGNISGISKDNPLKLSSDIWPALSTASKSFRVIAIPTSDLAVTLDMFDLGDIDFDDKTKRLQGSIVIENGMQYLEVSQTDKAHITLLEGDAGFAATTSFNGCPNQWSNGEIPADGYVYDVALGIESDKAMRFPTASATFAGTILNIGTVAAAGRAELNSSVTYTFPLLRLNNGMLVVTNISNPTKAINPQLAGAVEVCSNEQNPFVVEGNTGEFLIHTSVMRGDENAAFVFKGTGKNGDFRLNSGSSWGCGCFQNYKGKLILDGVGMIAAALPYGNTKPVSDAITLRNGATLYTTAATATYNSNAGIKVENTGAISSVYGSNFSLYNSVTGGQLTVFSPKANFYNKTSLEKLICNIATASYYLNFQKGAHCDNDYYEVKMGNMTFNEGVTFEKRDILPEIVVSGNLIAGASAMENLRLTLKSKGTFSPNNNGPTFQKLTLFNPSFAGGGKLIFDANPTLKEFDSMDIYGDSTEILATEENPLAITLNVVAKPQSLNKRYAFDLMTLPSSIGRITPDQIALTVNNTYEGANEETADEQVNFKVRVYEKVDGRKVVRISNKSDGTKFMIQ